MEVQRLLLSIAPWHDPEMLHAIATDVEPLLALSTQDRTHTRLPAPLALSLPPSVFPLLSLQASYDRVRELAEHSPTSFWARVAERERHRVQRKRTVLVIVENRIHQVRDA